MQMRCAWQELLNILPLWVRNDVDKLGKNTLQELRLRYGLPPGLHLGGSMLLLQRCVAMDDLHFVVNAAFRYSPWTAATLSQGYFTAPGGHRIGVCGEAVIRNGEMTGIREVSSLCIRIARDLTGIAPPIECGSVLIIGSPGCGKTTLLRDLIRYRSQLGTGSVAVVDERGEIFPRGFPAVVNTDVLTSCCKSKGVEILLRTMGPACIAVDEITAEEDCNALQQAAWCGVKLLATAHAANVNDLQSRPLYRHLISCGVFDTLIVMKPDKSWHQERMVV
jgi:stage III sporulation protein AA